MWSPHTAFFYISRNAWKGQETVQSTPPLPPSLSLRHKNIPTFSCCQFLTVLPWSTNKHTSGRMSTEMLTAKYILVEPLVFEPNALQVEKLTIHNSLGTDQIPAEMIKAGGSTIHSETHTLIGIRRNCLSTASSQLLYLSIRSVIKQM